MIVVIASIGVGGVRRIGGTGVHRAHPLLEGRREEVVRRREEAEVEDTALPVPARREHRPNRGVARPRHRRIERYPRALAVANLGGDRLARRQRHPEAEEDDAHAPVGIEAERLDLARQRLAVVDQLDPFRIAQHPRRERHAGEDRGVLHRDTEGADRQRHAPDRTFAAAASRGEPPRRQQQRHERGRHAPWAEIAYALHGRSSQCREARQGRFAVEPSRRTSRAPILLWARPAPRERRLVLRRHAPLRRPGPLAWGAALAPLGTEPADGQRVAFLAARSTEIGSAGRRARPAMTACAAIGSPSLGGCRRGFTAAARFLASYAGNSGEKRDRLLTTRELPGTTILAIHA